MNETAAREELLGTLLLDEPMSAHTSWRTGGPAERFYIAADLDDLVRYLSSRPAQEEINWIGLGSNLLVRDGGVRGSVVATAGVLNRLELREPLVVTAGAGVSCAKLARFSADRGLAGAEFLAGVPGTVGGALRMNAGAFGGETWDYVRSVETIDRRGRRRRRGRSAFNVSYRSVPLAEGEWFVGAEFFLQPDPARGAPARIRELLAQRAANQPTGVFSCGSVFKNPQGDYAGRLIEATGLKGVRCGGARVSEKHANFIINESEATAADIEQLVLLVQRRVREKTGVVLEPEVRIIGEPRGVRQ